MMTTTASRLMRHLSRLATSATLHEGTTPET